MQWWLLVIGFVIGALVAWLWSRMRSQEQQSALRIEKAQLEEELRAEERDVYVTGA